MLKDHVSQTAARATIASKLSGIEVYGGVVLNHGVGGLNPAVVETAIQYGAKVVWMPTINSKYHIEKFGGTGISGLQRAAAKAQRAGLSILDSEGELVPEVAEILRIVADADVCLATGHISPAEIKKLVGEASKLGIKKVLVTHANFFAWRLPLEEQQLARQGAYLEYAAVTCVSPVLYEQKPKELAEMIRAVGASSIVLSSDLGQITSPPPPEGMRMLIQALLEAGIKPEEIETMAKRNPARLLGLQQ